MKKRITTLLFAAILISTGGFAQKNAIKIMPLRTIGTAVSPLPTTINLKYERLIIPSLSAQIEFTYGLKKELALGAVEDVLPGTNNPEIGNWGFSPELRWYPTGLSDLGGFYVNGWYKYVATSVTWDLDIDRNLDFPVQGTTYQVPYQSVVTFNPSFNRYSFGVGIGSHWLAGPVSFDVQWIGLGLSGATLEARAENWIDRTAIANGISSRTPLTPAEADQQVDPYVDELVASMQESFDSFDTDELGVSIPGVELSNEVTEDHVSAQVQWRGGIAVRLFWFHLGFAF